MDTTLTSHMKKLLRIAESVTTYDDEINSIIYNAEALILKTSVLAIDEEDELTKNAIAVYVKANFGYPDKDIAERMMQSFQMMLSAMAMSPEYIYYTVTINAGEQTTVIFDGETKETNDAGVVIFHIRPKNHIEYVINGTYYYVDITGDTEITV